MSLFYQFGGEASMRAASGRFYPGVLAGPPRTPVFGRVGMPRLKAHPVAFLSQALGGPRQSSGAALSRMHARLRIEQRHFDAVASHLVETRRELGASEARISEVAGAAPLADQVVNTRRPAGI